MFTSCYLEVSCPALLAADSWPPAWRCLPRLPPLAMRSRLAPRKPRAKTAPSAPAFRYKTLGKTGLKVTTVGFGCMITSDGSVVERAADIGITYFDTARGYQGGNNERMVGAALKRKRKDIVLSTKTHAGTKEEALRDLDTSLKELGTDFVDIWYLHAKSAPAEVTDDLIEAQQIAKKAGQDPLRRREHAQRPARAACRGSRRIRTST